MTLSLSGIIDADRDITLAVNSLHTGFTDALWELFSFELTWIPLYIAVGVLLFWRLGWQRALVFVAAALLTFACCEECSTLVKDTVCRVRPCFDQDMLNRGLHALESGHLYGFFSAHAANAFGFACCSLIGLRTDKRWRYKGYAIGIFIWAALVSISRVFVGKHFVGDILVGAAVGLIIGALWGFLARRFINYLARRKR